MGIANSSYALLSETAKRASTGARRHAELWVAKQRLLLGSTALAKDKALLRQASLRIHPLDGMYVEDGARHYLRVGLSAIRCIEAVLASPEARDHSAPQSILDLPCGYGRVLRFLRARFPSAAITASEVDPHAVDFCESAFAATGVMSSTNFDELVLPGPFNLIWCGSLITHLDCDATAGVLRLLHRHLAPGGIAIFTTHGRLTVEWIETGHYTYLLSSPAKDLILSDFHETGYGYSGYEIGSGYGVSLASHDRMTALAKEAGDWEEILFADHLWDDHQDVHAWRRQRLN